MTYQEAFEELLFLRSTEDMDAEYALRDKMASEILGESGVKKVLQTIRFEELAELADDTYLTDEEAKEYDELYSLLS